MVLKARLDKREQLAKIFSRKKAPDKALFFVVGAKPAAAL
jgi:hypothetical protein